MAEDQGEITRLLSEARNGRPDALDRLLVSLYPALRSLAAKLMRGERDGHTLQPTALVNEAVIRIFLRQDVEIADRTHMMALAGRQMRRILVEHARARLTERRGKGVGPMELDERQGAEERDMEALVILDQLLEQLREVDPRAGEVVEMRFFAGLSREEVAERLNVAVRTVQRDWEFARAWLLGELGRA